MKKLFNPANILFVIAMAIGMLILLWNTVGVYTEYRYEGEFQVTLAEAVIILDEYPNRYSVDYNAVAGDEVVLTYDFAHTDNVEPELEYEEVKRPATWYGLLIISTLCTGIIVLCARLLSTSGFAEEAK